MSQDTLTKPTTGGTSTNDDGLDHWYCCDPNWSLCGKDLTDWEQDDSMEEATCIVCEELSWQQCPDCGWEPPDA